MATPNAGITASIPVDQVRMGILTAMQIGKPTDPALQIRFIKKGSGKRYFLGEDDEQFPPPVGTLRLDRDGRPLNPNVRMVDAEDEAIEADCAIELAEVNADETPVGNFRPVKATVTVMDVEYAKVAGHREITYNHDRYAYQYELEANGLGEMTFHTLIYFAVDET